MKTKPSKKDSPDRKTEPKAIEVSSPEALKALQARCVRLLTIEITHDEINYSFQARRLSAAEDAKLRDHLDVVIPPMKAGKTPDEDRPDFLNADYVKRKNKAEIEARSLALYWCVPVLNGSHPELTSIDAITAHVQAQLPEQMLNALHQSVTRGGVSQAAIVNFTSASS